MIAMAKVTSKGQITLPREIRVILNINTGSVVEFENHNGNVVLKRAETLQDYKGVLRGRQKHAVFGMMRRKAKELVAGRTKRASSK